MSRDSSRGARFTAVHRSVAHAPLPPPYAVDRPGAGATSAGGSVVRSGLGDSRREPADCGYDAFFSAIYVMAVVFAIWAKRLSNAALAYVSRRIWG